MNACSTSVYFGSVFRVLGCQICTFFLQDMEILYSFLVVNMRVSLVLLNVSSTICVAMSWHPSCLDARLHQCFCINYSFYAPASSGCSLFCKRIFLIYLMVFWLAGLCYACTLAAPMSLRSVRVCTDMSRAARHRPASCRSFPSPLLLLERSPHLCNVCPSVVLRRQTILPIGDLFPRKCLQSPIFPFILRRIESVKYSLFAGLFGVPGKIVYCQRVCLYYLCYHQLARHSCNDSTSCIRHRISTLFEPLWVLLFGDYPL